MSVGEVDVTENRFETGHTIAFGCQEMSVGSFLPGTRWLLWFKRPQDLLLECESC